jgi:hypothetical protein
MGPSEILFRTKAAQRLQGCGYLRSDRMAADPSGVDSIPDRRSAELGDEGFRYRILRFCA